MAKRPSKKTEQARLDGYINAVTGVGNALRDKRRGARFHVNELTAEQEENLWRGDDMAARVVELPVDEMLRNGFDIKIDEDAPDTGTTKTETEQKNDAGAPPFTQPKPGAPMIPSVPAKPPGVIEPRNAEGKALAKAVLARYEELRGPEMVQLAGHFERAHGGGAIILGVDDGSKDMTQPLNEDNISSLTWLNVLTPREMQAVRYYADPMAPKFGMPEVYRVQADVMSGDMATGLPTQKIQVSQVLVHESRCIIFPGTAVSRRQRMQRQGWGDSVFVRVAEILADFQGSYAGAAHLITDFAQAVMKVKGLADALIQKNDAVIVKRAQMIDMSRSLARMVLLDSEEDFERKATPVAGLPELLEKIEHRFAAAADMPVTLLMGISPGGLGSNGEQEIRFFYDRIKAKQHRMLKPRLERLLRIIMLSKDGPTKGTEPESWCVEFAPLWQMSDKEQADMRFVQAQTDEKYIANGVVIPEEIAASRFGGGRWSPDTVIDIDMRQQAASDYEDAKATAADAQAKAAKAVAAAPAPAPAPPPAK
jgi:phage-related protein (TIGR01555 family)